MMKLHIVSDLHIEFGNPFIPCEPADVLILAGDIHKSGTGLYKWIKESHILDQYEKVLYVTGNHEYYRQPMDEVHEILEGLEVLNHNFYWLNNQSVKIGDVEFYGGTMWTYTEDESVETKSRIERGMNDFNLIHTRKARWNLVLADQEFAKFRDGLDRLVHTQPETNDSQIVVISHHVPTDLATPKRYSGNSLNAAYVEDMSSFFPSVDCWAFGHSHVSFDQTIDGCRVVSNAYGYHKYEVNRDFNPNFIVEI